MISKTVYLFGSYGEELPTVKPEDIDKTQHLPDGESKKEAVF
ncbi:hypothetical protein QWI17_15865 [Gilvimarinus sp. SDUM040013]|uniref:Uncharacterized protein n=1 Tax=Gilvimarinus gilvus TaxID=3058038 RepID=A0ABU4RVX1_9GAMM|nr:hypothetical protein [Gilvimarinus sp. SDUM040013]MDO3387318.1 hypothetical protein [Gilvimarinus sp. SDUM040013]MDX6849007.1 hypothetical protein [Gilvimarinus sp. SDUM040013]